MHQVKTGLRLYIRPLGGSQMLEGLHEALTTSVVIGVGWPAHAREHVVRSQEGHVGVGGILDAAIGMIDPQACAD
jgi:hypothetical protein